MISVPRIVVAGTSSGVGKTTVTVALARALCARGLRVALFKCGPDYLDPTYHARATGRPSQTLDGWMMGKDAVLSTFSHASTGADVAVVEGMMGLYDGAEPAGDRGSTAEIARWLDAPVLLVADASGMSGSIAAVAHGFASFDARVRVSGLVANRIGGRAHLELLQRAQARPPVLGGLPLDAEHAFPERHLGLVAADASVLPEARLDHWGERAAGWLGIDAALAIARSAPAIDAPGEPPRATRPPLCRIGIARDAAFHFYYADNLRRLEACGAEIVPFSRVADARLPDVDGLYFGGGYPEALARELAANTAMREAVLAFARSDRPVYAECGGLMYLSDAIVTLDGAHHPMAGVVPTQARMREGIQAIGYVDVELRRGCPLGAAGTRFRGHQFRCSELVPPPDTTSVERLYAMRRPGHAETLALEGYGVRSVVATYVHAHWASCPSIPESFVAACCLTR